MATQRRPTLTGPPPVPVETIEYRETNLRCPRCRAWRPRLFVCDDGRLTCEPCLGGRGAGGPLHGDGGVQDG